MGVSRSWGHLNLLGRAEEEGDIQRKGYNNVHSILLESFGEC